MSDQQFIFAMLLGAGSLFICWAAYKAIQQAAAYWNVRTPNAINPEIGKTLISFDTTSDQGLMRDFQYVGVIVGTCVDEDNWRSKYYKHEYFYKVKVIVSQCERKKVGEIIEVPAWYCVKKEIIIHLE